MKTETTNYHFNSGITLESGESLSAFDLVVETYGELNADKSNAILVCHAFSGSHNAAGESDTDGKLGWWDEIVGPNKAIDTNKFFVVSPNNLGSCFGSTGPTSICPKQMRYMEKIFQTSRCLIGLIRKKCC